MLSGTKIGNWSRLLLATALMLIKDWLFATEDQFCIGFARLVHFGFIYNLIFFLSFFIYVLKDGDLNVVKYLLEKGANLSLRNDSGRTPLDIVVEVSFFFNEFFVCDFLRCRFNFFFKKRMDANSLSFLRLLLLHGANPLDVGDRAVGKAKHEMTLFLANPIRYHSNHSALIALAIGLVSIDLPVLIVTLISEYLVSINEEKLFGQYSEQKSWNIAALVKKKAQIEN